MGLNRPSRAAMSEGKPKMLAPIIVLSIRAARLHRPIVRLSRDVVPPRPLPNLLAVVAVRFSASLRRQLLTNVCFEFRKSSPAYHAFLSHVGAQHSCAPARHDS